MLGRPVVLDALGGLAASNTWRPALGISAMWPSAQLAHGHCAVRRQAHAARMEAAQMCSMSPFLVV